MPRFHDRLYLIHAILSVFIVLQTTATATSLLKANLINEEYCATIFQCIPNAVLRLNDTDSNTIAYYDATGVTVNYIADGDDPFASLSVLGYITRTSIEGNTESNFLASILAEILLLDAIYTNNGPYQRGQTVMNINELGRQPDWQYYRPIFAQISSLDSQYVFQLRGHFFNSLMRNLQLGTGANSGYIQDFGCAWDFDARYEGQLTFNYSGVFQFNLGNDCSCERTMTALNWNGQPFESGPIDYAVFFDPQFRRNNNRIDILNFSSFGNFSPAVWGLDKTANSSSSSNILHFRGFAVNPYNVTNLFEYDLWFRGRASMPPSTGYGAYIGTPGPDWQFFDLIQGTMSFVSDNSSNMVYQLNSSEILYNGPSAPGQLGPSLQVGTGANIINPNIYGGLFMFMYIFTYGVGYHAASLTIALTQTCS